MSSRTPKWIWLGYDTREALAFAIAAYTIRRFDKTVPIASVVLRRLQEGGLYTRGTDRRAGEWTDSNGRKWASSEPVLWDAPSQHTMSTEHANARFFVPHLQRLALKGRKPFGWALVCDCDVMFLQPPERFFALADPSKALMCVHHEHRPDEATKMDGQVQSRYERKNQSSAMLLNLDHPANDALTLEVCNTWPGRDLHAFRWLPDDLIGELPQECNYLVGVSTLPEGRTPWLVHFTRGLPDMAGYERQEYAEQWRALKPYAVGAL